jgi:hypothetical protein
VQKKPVQWHQQSQIRWAGPACCRVAAANACAWRMPLMDELQVTPTNRKFANFRSWPISTFAMLQRYV